RGQREMAVGGTAGTLRALVSDRCPEIDYMKPLARRRKSANSPLMHRVPASKPASHSQRSLPGSVSGTINVANARPRQTIANARMNRTFQAGMRYSCETGDDWGRGKSEVNVEVRAVGRTAPPTR